MPKKKTHEEFINEANLKNDKLEILGTYVNYKDNILVRCKKCGYTYYGRPDHILHGIGCGVCSNKVVAVGYNDMWTTNSELASLLANPEDGYKYTYGSLKKVDWKCPICGNVMHNKTIYQIYRNGLHCTSCDDGISYPTKLFTNILNQLNLSFKTEKSFNWIKPKRYDFYIPSINCVCEIHGEQHYIRNFTMSDKTLEDIQNNDKYKKDKAIENKLLYIEIDARNSDLEWIKNSIMKSDLSFIFNLSNIDWNEAHKNALQSKVIECCNLYNNGIKDTLIIANMLHINRNTVPRYLAKCTEIGLCNYISVNKSPIRCVTTNEYFQTIKEACDKYGIGQAHISDCCIGNRKYAGKHPVTGDPMLWVYEKDYDITKNYNIKGATKRSTQVAVRCLNTIEEFESISEAAKYFKIGGASTIADCCKGMRISSGKHPITGEKLRWEYA